MTSHDAIPGRDEPRLVGDRTHRGTRRAVRRAIRTGHAPDARIDELARAEAQKTVDNVVVLRIYSVIFAVQLVLLVLRITTGGAPATLVLYVIADSCWALGLGLLAVHLSRSRKYLRDRRSGPA